MTKKPILILQFRTGKALAHEKECLETKGRISPKNTKYINVIDPNEILPKPADLDNYSAVIVGGSGEIDISNWDTNTKKRIEKLKPFFLEIVKRDFPALMVCFGHQLLSYFLGEKVEADNSQSEVGTFEVTLTKEGKKSPIFKNIPEKFWVVVAHKDSVMNLPKGAKLLANSEKCKIQSYQLGENIFTTQFHAEIDKEALAFRLSLYPTYLKGKSIDEIMQNFHETPYATKILQNWANTLKH